jgi:hypothetical protein
MQSNTYFAHTACTVAALVILTACTARPPGPTYEEYVGRWVEETEVSLVSAWGIPKNTHSLETGGRIVEYTREFEGDVNCTTRFTIDESGKIVKYWYLGEKCRAPRG